MCGKLCFLILVMCLAKNAVLENPVSCQSCTRNSYPYVGIETAYFYVHNDSEETMILTNCKPTLIWMLRRYGTRYSSEHMITQMLNLTHIRDQIKMTEICICKHPCGKRDLENWKLYPELVPGMGRLVAVQDEKDLAFLVERNRMKLLTKTLFDKNAIKNMEFKSTATQGTSISIKSFIKALKEIIGLILVIIEFISIFIVDSGIKIKF